MADRCVTGHRTVFFDDDKFAATASIFGRIFPRRPMGFSAPVETQKKNTRTALDGLCRPLNRWL
jgi:hypothetical protein